MKSKKEVVVQEPTEAEIQHAAYLLWVENDRPEGSDLEHWLTAKEMLCHRHGRDATTGPRALEIAAPVRKSTTNKKPSNAPRSATTSPM
jgi:hypothetical protein